MPIQMMSGKYNSSGIFLPRVRFAGATQGVRQRSTDHTGVLALRLSDAGFGGGPFSVASNSSLHILQLHVACLCHKIISEHDCKIFSFYVSGLFRRRQAFKVIDAAMVGR
jgi:hypothetical protein